MPTSATIPTAPSLQTSTFSRVSLAPYQEEPRAWMNCNGAIEKQRGQITNRLFTVACIATPTRPILQLAVLPETHSFTDFCNRNLQICWNLDISLTLRAFSGPFCREVAIFFSSVLIFYHRMLNTYVGLRAGPS